MTVLTLAPTIDLSVLPAPLAIEALSYEDLRSARLSSLKARFEAIGIAYDVENSELDPGVILQEEDAFRQLLDRSRINDAVRAVLAAYAYGADLDQVALRAGVIRLVVAPATDTSPAVMEGDAHLLQRYLAAFGRPAAGSIDAYLYAVLTALPLLTDVAILGPETHGLDGRIKVILLPPGGVAATETDIETAFNACNAKTVRPLTDVISVQSAEIVPYDVGTVLEVPIGPDAGLIRSTALTALRAYCARQYRVGASVPANALSAALYVGNVSRVIMSAPSADIAISPYQAPFLRNNDVTVTVVG